MSGHPCHPARRYGGIARDASGATAAWRPISRRALLHSRWRALLGTASSRPRRRASRTSTRARPSRSSSATASAAATTSMARLLARHLGKHIPGQPTVVPQNMPGAGSLQRGQLSSTRGAEGRHRHRHLRAQHGGRAAARRGARSTAPSSPGSAASPTTSSLCVTWHTSPIKTWDDMLDQAVHDRRRGRRRRSGHLRAALQERVRRQAQAGHRLSGHQRRRARHGARRGRRPVRPVLEHREERAIRDWLTDKKINILVQAGLQEGAGPARRAARRSISPRPPEQTQIVKLVLASQEMARPFAAPPGMPADRKAALIAAFDETMKDPDFLAEAKKLEAGRQSGQRAARSTPCWRRSTRRRRSVIAKAAKADGGMSSAFRRNAGAIDDMAGLIGSRIPRLEDDALLRGRGRFVDDIVAAGRAACGLRAQPASACADPRGRQRARRWRCRACMRCSRSTISRR